MQYRVSISARKQGAIGIHGTEKRSYTVDAETIAEATRSAIDRAYEGGGIEHVHVEHVYLISTKGQFEHGAMLRDQRLNRGGKS